MRVVLAVSHKAAPLRRHLNLSAFRRNRKWTDDSWTRHIPDVETCWAAGWEQVHLRSHDSGVIRCRECQTLWFGGFTCLDHQDKQLCCFILIFDLFVPSGIFAAGAFTCFSDVTFCHWCHMTVVCTENLQNEMKVTWRLVGQPHVVSTFTCPRRLPSSGWKLRSSSSFNTSVTISYLASLGTIGLSQLGVSCTGEPDSLVGLFDSSIRFVGVGTCEQRFALLALAQWSAIRET